MVRKRAGEPSSTKTSPGRSLISSPVVRQEARPAGPCRNLTEPERCLPHHEKRLARWELSIEEQARYWAALWGRLQDMRTGILALSGGHRRRTVMGRPRTAPPWDPQDGPAASSVPALWPLRAQGGLGTGPVCCLSGSPPHLGSLERPETRM